MNVRKPITAIATFSMLTFILTGCFPGGQQSVPSPTPASGTSDNSDTTDISLPDIQNLTVNVEFEDNYPSSAPLLELCYPKWDNEAVKNAFLGDKVIVNENTNELVPSYHHYVTDDGCNLVIDKDKIFFTKSSETADSQRYMADRALDITTNSGTMVRLSDYKLIYPSNELDLFPSSDAIERVNNILAEIGVTQVGKPEVYSCTADLINERNKKRFDSTEATGERVAAEDVSESDAVYILQYPIAFNDVPLVSHESPTSDELVFTGSRLKAVVSENEIIYFDFRFPLFSCEETGETVQFGADAKTALNIIVDDYSKKSILSPTEIYECKLVYVPNTTPAGYSDDIDDTFTFRPVWCFGCIERDESGEVNKNFYKYVDAEKATIYANFS